MDISADENGTIEIDGEEFDLVENKWTRVYITKIFPSTNTKNIRVRTLYSKGHSRDIVYGNNLIDNLATDLNLIYYRNLQVQKGKIPTVHTLTPEEIEEYNERNKSEIKQLVDSISMMVKKDELSTEVIQNAESWGLSINGKLKGQNYEFNVDNFRIGGESSDRVEHDNLMSRYIHSDGSYTQIGAGGLQRFVAGTGRNYQYMTVVGSGTQTVSTPTDSSYYQQLTIQLPDEFKGKDFEFYASISDVYVFYNSYIRRFTCTSEILSKANATCRVNLSVEFEPIIVVLSSDYNYLAERTQHISTPVTVGFVYFATL